jgi:hypothetical protein
VDDLAGPEQVSRGNARAGGTDIQSLGEFNEFGSGSIRRPQEYGHLEPYAG